MSVKSPKLTVYFDGSCPLCRSEMSYYEAQDVAGAICFSDIADLSQSVPRDLSRQQAKSRLHVRKQNGDLVAGAAAFVSVWQALPNWAWAARIAALPGITPSLEIAYRLFLPVRPVISILFGALQKSRS
ncbi:MAG TPA: DUF393 domain-containing protein [Spirochaetia bacterium]|nr:DUF393 domain-containing protein [Spirochaetia bacterium]